MILPFHGKPKIFGLVTALGQSWVVFDTFTKMALFASAENMIFALFFQNAVTWSIMNINT